MGRVKYYSAEALMTRAGEVMIPMENQLPAQRQIASIIAMHLCKILALNRGASPNEVISVSAFLVGATGSGKSYIIKSLAEICGLRFRQIDCTTISQAGVRGKNIADCLGEIKREDARFFSEGGILNLDEADKTFYKHDAHYDAYSPQQDLLKLFEGSQYTFTVGERTESVNLDRTLILLSGACSGIAETLKRKHCKRSPIGFLDENPPLQTSIEDYATLITIEDLIDYGMMAELASRVNTVIHIPKIDKDGYKKLLSAEAKSSATNRFCNLFAMRGIQMDITSNAIEAIAQECVVRDVGARSVQAILNENLLDGYRIADDNSACNRVCLDVGANGKLFVSYYSGTRNSVPHFVKAYEEENFSLIQECSEDEKINSFSDEMTQNACLANIADERLLYYFLQTVCRYMRDEIRPADRCFASVLKLAEATTCVSLEENHKSAFDYICGDYLEKLTKAAAEQEKYEAKLVTFRHYYNAFRKENRAGPGMDKVLNEALLTAGRYYNSLKTMLATV